MCTAEDEARERHERLRAAVEADLCRQQEPANVLGAPPLPPVPTATTCNHCGQSVRP